MALRTIVVSGIPAAGKTTLGRLLACELELRCYDKDDFLEARFCSDAISPDERKELSRKADRDLMNAVNADPTSVVVSFWRQSEMPTHSGTPTDWLLELDGVVEVYCDCSPRLAAQRFVARDRHAGHDDRSKSIADIEAAFDSLASLGPIGIGEAITVSTDSPVDLPDLLRALQ